MNDAVKEEPKVSYDRYMEAKRNIAKYLTLFEMSKKATGKSSPSSAMVKVEVKDSNRLKHIPLDDYSSGTNKLGQSSKKEGWSSTSAENMTSSEADYLR